jgi:NTP pyrophosphatase (non-canonical NTP hydrolase)
LEGVENVETTEKELQFALSQVGAEFLKARKKFNPMRGAHEGYAVILEELDELWEAVKRNDLAHARKEAVQVAAMALAFMLEVKNGTN